MVHQHDGRPVARLRQCTIQPRDSLRAELTAAFARDDGVDSDDAQRMFVDRILNEFLRLPKMRVIDKRVAQRVTLSWFPGIT